MAVVSLRTQRAVPDGPVAYRHRVRRFGPLMALAVPLGGVLLAGLIANGVECTGKACAVKGAVVFLVTLCALPTAMLLGVPWEGGAGRYLLALVTSAAVWAVVGGVAAYQATRLAVASWRDWWAEFLVVAVGIWAGVVVALVAVGVALGGLSLV